MYQTPHRIVKRREVITSVAPKLQLIYLLIICFICRELYAGRAPPKAIPALALAWERR